MCLPDRGIWLLAGTVLFAAAAAPAETKSFLYAAAGPELTVYAADANAASLTPGPSVTLPQNVQEAWPHPSGRYLYVAWSNNLAGGPGQHGVTAFRIDPGNGALTAHAKPIMVAARAVFITVDGPGKHLLVAYNQPSRVTVHRLAGDGTIGAPVPQAGDLDFRIYAHQVRVDPANGMVVVPARGNVATADKPEDPGAIQVFAYRDGVLRNHASIAPGGGRNFAPRHLDFHPSRPFAFVTIEAQNKLHVYRVVDGASLSVAPLFSKETLTDPKRMAGQATSAIHVHPNGRFGYLGNRGTATTDFKGHKVPLGGAENSIAVYSINQETGEPVLIQSAETRGVHPRTFTIDPSGRMLVVANMQETSVRDKNDVLRTLPASLAVFRVKSDGKLEFVRKYDRPTGSGRGLFWTGMVTVR